MVRDLIRYLGKKYVNRFLQMGKNVKILVSHINAHQKVISDEEKFNNREDMSHSADSQPYHPAFPIIANEPMNKVGVMHKFYNMDFYSPRLILL